MQPFLPPPHQKKKYIYIYIFILLVCHVPRISDSGICMQVWNTGYHEVLLTFCLYMYICVCVYVYKFSCPLENHALNNFKKLLLSLFLISALLRDSQGVRHATRHWESPKWENYLEIFHRLFFYHKVDATHI